MPTTAPAAPAAAVAGAMADWPKEARDRPVFARRVVYVDSSGYLTTGERAPGSFCPELPARREYYASDLKSLSDLQRVTWAVCNRGVEFLETDFEDPGELPYWVEALEDWLDQRR